MEESIYSDIALFVRKEQFLLHPRSAHNANYVHRVYPTIIIIAQDVSTPFQASDLSQKTVIQS